MREGDAVILRPHVKDRELWANLRAALERGMSDDFFAEGRQQPDMAPNSNYDDLFECAPTCSTRTPPLLC